MSEMPAVRGLSDQLRLFPRLAMATLTRPVTDLYAIARPARTFTGDFYFTHRYEDRLWFAIGDVAGKGLNAAVVMAMIQEELEERVARCAMTKCNPAATMLRLHEFLRPLLAPSRFASAVIGHVHDRGGTLMLANAGHCPPLIRRANGSIERIDSTGPVAGVLAASQWTAFETRLEPGDAIALYTDGLVESTNDGEEVGVDRVARAFAHSGARSARELAERIVETAGCVDDDLTVLVVRR